MYCNIIYRDNEALEILHEINAHMFQNRDGSINQQVEDFKNELEKEYGAIKVNVETGEYTEITKEELENV